MTTAFQSTAFQNGSFQIDAPNPFSETAFQPNAFQQNAFQISHARQVVGTNVLMLPVDYFLAGDARMQRGSAARRILRSIFRE